jgi:exopolyphosphatase / guanosine-5'-triphosphate,3'-diphosphate pyrophosphatase
VTEAKRRAIIDIGSNSIRLVVFGGAPRAPVVLYNEKYSAGLGKAVIATGALDPVAVVQALAALRRFHALVELMQVDMLRVVATAATRDASNGPEFLKSIRDIGLLVELLSGDEEAVASGFGVISAQPMADGIAADLGGGSLELVRIRNGDVFDRVSLPLGILRVPEIIKRGEGKLRKHILKQIETLDWLQSTDGLPLYLVGGSWRSLARVHIELTGFPLAVIGNHHIPVRDLPSLLSKLAVMDRSALKQIPSLPSARIPMLLDSAALLSALVDVLRPSRLVACASGLREGLLFQSLTDAERQQDPLIAGAQFAADQQRRFPGYGEALSLWLDQLFGTVPEELSRLRHAACLLADLGWASNPEFRAISAEEMALHGNWVGVSARDRAIIAMALYASFGGSGSGPEPLEQIISQDDIEMARSWGLAIRLAHRLGGGTAGALESSELRREGNSLILSMASSLGALDNNSVRRRFERLAEALALAPVLEIRVL